MSQLVKLPKTLKFSQAQDCFDVVIEQIKQVTNSQLVEIDASQLTEFDSSALAVLVGVVRKVRQNKQQVIIKQLPAKLMDLAKVYGILDLLPLSN